MYNIRYSKDENNRLILIITDPPKGLEYWCDQMNKMYYGEIELNKGIIKKFLQRVERLKEKENIIFSIQYWIPFVENNCIYFKEMYRV